MTGFKVVDTQDNDRVVQTFDEQRDAMVSAGNCNRGWPRMRFLVYPMEPGDLRRADHVVRK